MMSSKINFASFAAALALFFLPWLDFQCSEKTMVTQSGIQIAYGGASASPQFETSGSGSSNESKDDDEMEDSLGGVSVLVGLAFVAVVVGLITAFLIFRGSRMPAKVVPGLAGLALASIGLQMMVGFPIEKSVKESQSPSGPEGEAKDGMKQMGAMLAQINIGVVYRPWLYLEMAFLALPLSVAFFGMQPKKPLVRENPEIEF